ncbi:hypothetical protein ACFFGT_20145 [Mucilaginibacter angelicae]|uniref:LPXTG cell wall anchor domain-containing protein n=1 Tax=Mucilaginibacter angelicae TaxID=869718 RepID=A0ABV6LAS4_9SPHI
MKALKIKLAMMLLGLTLGSAAPLFAQSSKDTSTTTAKANGSGAGTGVSQGAPGAATVSGTGTGTLQDSDKASVPSGDAGVKQTTDQKAVNPSQVSGYWILGVFSLIGLVALIVLRKTRKVNS